MPISMPPTVKAEIERPHGSRTMIWLCELQLSRPFQSGMTVVPSTIFRITTHHTTLAWPASSPFGDSWAPFNFSFSPIEQNQEGDLPQLDLTVDNSARVLMRYLHDGDGLEGNYALLYLVPTSALAIPYPNQESAGQFEFQIAGAFASDEGVTFRLERSNFFQRTSPQDRYVASRCRWEFGSDECGYIINDVAAFHTCPKLIDACAQRGLDHAARGLPVLHPARFGGFPGIPKQR